jgi:hypothetical protein
VSEPAIGEGGESSEAAGTILAWVGLRAMLVTVTFQLVREGRSGQTVGKKILRIRSVRDRGGQVSRVCLSEHSQGLDQ